MGAIIGGVLGIIGAGKQAKAAKKAAKIQAEAGRESLAFQREIFETTETNAAPFIEAGGLGLEALLSELGLGEAPIINGEQFAGFQESPGFKFAFQKGVDAVDASAAAGGGLFSGSTLEDLTKFGQGFASQERGTFLNRLQSLVSVGQTGVGQVAGAGSVFAQGGSQTIEGIGNAQSAGVIGVANARAQQLNSLGTTLGGVASLFGDFSGLFSSSFAPQTSPTPLIKPF